MFVLPRTMDNHELNNDSNTIQHDLPGFGWMYEGDPSATTRSHHFNKTRKKQGINPSSAPASSQSLPFDDEKQESNEFVPYSGASAPTTLAYVDVNSRTHWPIPPLNSVPSARIDGHDINSQEYANVGPFAPAASSASGSASSVPSSSLLAASLSSLPMGLSPRPSTGPAFGSLGIERGIGSPDASPGTRSSQFADLADRDLFGAASAIDLKPPGSLASTLFDQPPSLGIDTSNSLGSVQKAPVKPFKATSPRTNTAGGRSFEGSSKGSQEKRCPVCAKKLRRDLTRHMRIHEAVADFACPFPRKKCAHKHGQFNRPYEYKKHLMNYHFKLDDPASSKKAANLSEKLMFSGKCQCGEPFGTVGEWINKHIGNKECTLLKHSQG